MRTSRLNPVLLGALLLGAAACQRETAARTEKPNPATEVSATDTALPAEAPLATRRDWHRLARRTNPHAPLIHYAAVRRPASLPAPALPTEARLLDLTLKPSEFFRIDPTQPAEVRGREGTVVRLPAGALLDARQQPAQGPVWLELKECLALADLLLSDHVSTGPDGTPMQAGGMLLVRAVTSKGQALHLAPGAAIVLNLPAELHAGRQLYHSPDRQHWAALPADTAPESGPAYAQASSTAGSSILDTPAESSANHNPAPLTALAEPGLDWLRSTELGWLSCLRGWHPEGAAQLLVPTEADDHTVVRLVYPEAGVILAGQPQAAGYAFQGLPAQQRAVLVGLRYEGGNAFLAVQSLAPGDTAAPLEFREVSLADIEQRLQELR
ncbi:hypothetical protein [Hymenobacter jeollabukensis]|uniref:Uncharacterized protein n=1 Tax=Hymenobacter jeollabukensis TaxID=2025313 RepID=A0A5R8WU03_9BACT|nr:hypothetical protein [Hymenobacter jeollabukensis]TLM95250.1 hypothetical protein FDY95_05540 [Hymenobacter jeollabukensis]